MGGILGVIGGLGPAATTYFMELVTRMTEAETEQENVDMIVYNFPSIPDRTGYILGSNLKSPLPGLLSVGRALTEQGVSQIAIPCVTAHYFHDALQAALPVPVINAVAETARLLRGKGITRSGIMATDGTIRSRLFADVLEANGITALAPSEERQRDVMGIIYEDIKAGNPANMTAFRAVQKELLGMGAEAIILGCTELSLVKRDCPIGGGFVDAMEVLAQQAILRCGKKLKPQYEQL